MNDIFDKILHYEDRAEFFQIFWSFFGGQWSFNKNYYLRLTDLYKWNCVVKVICEDGFRDR